MKRKPLFTLILAATMLIQCSKSKDQTPAPDLKSGLLAFFQLNGNFDDSTKAIQDANYGGFISDAKNRHGYANRAMYFNGGLFSFGTGGWSANPITVSLWVKPKDLNNDNYLVISQEGAFGVYQTGSKLGLAVSIPATASALADIGVEWTHFAGTYDGKDIKTYINGKLANTLHHPGTADLTSVVNVGAKDVPEWLGAIDDLRFYSRVLSAEEIKLLSEL